MKKQLFYFTLLLTFSLTGGLYAQDWVEKMKNPDVNFYDVQKAFNKYYVKKDRQIERQKRRMSKRQGEGVHQEEIEVPGFAQYKRWENFMAPRVFPTGERFDPSLTWRENEKYRKQFSTQTAGSWTLIGPTSTIPIGGGAGRLNFVRFEPGNANTIYVGSPAGGLWKSTDAGLTWSTNTDQLAQVIGCTDIAIDPTNVNTMYLATGDGDAGDTYTIGILKSTDGGQTWNTTGLSYYMANTRQISRILIDPTNTSTLLVASSAGIFRSTDAGATFTLVQTGILLGGIFYLPIYEEMAKQADWKAWQEQEQPVPQTEFNIHEASGDSIVMNKYVYANQVIRTEKIEFSKTENFTTSKVTQRIELSSPNLWMMGLLIFIQLVFVTMAYGPIAAFLVELFPVQIRYTSMSLPYHIGNGVFGGLTPLIAESLVLQSGNIFAGLYYPITVAFITFIIGAIFIKKSNTFTVHQS